MALVLGVGPVWQVWHGASPTSVAPEPVIAADREGVVLGVTSGWRDSGKQQQLYDAAIAKYGSAAKARRWVLPPQESQHVRGGAVDVGPPTAAIWLDENGVRYGLCRRYANEPWHFELLAPHKGQPCPAMEPHP